MKQQEGGNKKKSPLQTRLFKAVVRINSYNEEFDFINPLNRGNNTKSSGSGFFIDSSGHILTCAHCVDNATKVTCTIPSEGQREFDVEILGVCPFYDIAMLKVKKYKVKHTLKLAPKKLKIEPGCETRAVGFPLGTDFLQLTKGILSGVQDNFYQTDTPINPGNSGGPLMLGEYVIGINAAGVLMADNIGYAVPIYRVNFIEDELKKKKYLIHYPALLFEYQKSNTSFNKCINNKCDGGVIVTDVPKASIFSKSDLKQGDVLCKVNGKAIDNFGSIDSVWLNQKMSIKSFVSNIKLGSKVDLSWYRKGKLISSSFMFKETKAPIRQMFPSYEKIDHFEFAGMIFMNLSVNHLEERQLKNPEVAQYILEKNQSEGKVILVNILADSVVNEWKIFKKGDIIECVNDVKIGTVDQMKRAIKKSTECGSISMKNSKNCIIFVDKKMAT